MALFPGVPFGAAQGSTPGPLFGVSDYKFPVKRGVRRRTGQHVFCDFSRLKYRKGGAPLHEFEMQFGNLTVAQKETLRTFFVSAQAEADTWSTTFDGISYSGCRFLGGFEARLQGTKIWTVTLQVRALHSSTQPIPAYTSGSAAPIITPSVAATATVSWNTLWNASGPLTFPNGQTTISFDATHNATMSYVPGSGGEGTTGDSTGDNYDQYGALGNLLVEPNGTLGVGPVFVGTFTPGQEVVAQVTTTGSVSGTVPGTTFYSGPSWRNPDGNAHAAITWAIP